MSANGTDDELEDYILAHISPEPEHLERVWRHTYLHHLYPRMCSGHLQGRLLSMLSHMIRPRMALELGTFTGYSALSLAEGVVDGGELHTVEIDDEKEQELRELFATAPHSHKVRLHIGDALQVMDELDKVWDLVYIDANKRCYVEYLEAVLPKVRPGGFIIADNTLWAGKVAHPGVPGADDPQTVGLRAFNDLVASRQDLEKVMLPLRDGLTLIRKRE